MDSEVKIGEPIDIPGKIVGEYADKLRSKVHTKWEAAVIDNSEYLDPTKPFKPPEWALSLRGVPFYAFSDYNYLQGQAGNGKSFTFTIYESVILGKDFGDVKYIGEKRSKPKILHVDTEQSEGNVQLHVRRLYHMVGWEQGSDHSDQLKVLMLRETPKPEDRWAKIIRACHDFKPDFLFVDGMLDVVKGMNDDEDCNMVISEAGALASIFNLCMIGVNHENPRNPKAQGDGPDKPAGCIGSYSQRKGSAGQGTVKELNGTEPLFKVKPKKVRNKDYEEFWFRIRDELVVCDGIPYWMGIPYWVEVDDKPVKNEDDENEKQNKLIVEVMQNIQWSIDGLRYTDVESGLKQQGIKSNRKISDYITMAKQIGIISQNEATKRYYLVYTDENTDTQTSIEEEPMPF